MNVPKWLRLAAQVLSGGRIDHPPPFRLCPVCDEPLERLGGYGDGTGSVWMCKGKARHMFGDGVPRDRTMLDANAGDHHGDL